MVSKSGLLGRWDIKLPFEELADKGVSQIGLFLGEPSGGVARVRSMTPKVIW
jgi:hypothetical protein